MKKFTDLSLENYLQELSSPEIVPGGGSVSAYAAALAMGLTQMVGRISLKRKKKEGLTPEESRKEDERRERIQKIIDSVEKTKRDAFSIVNLDPVVYEELTQSYGQPQKLEDSLWKSYQMQADLVGLVILAAGWNTQLKGLVSGSIKNDLLVSDALSKAAFDGAYHTAMINVVYMKDPEKKQRAEKALEELKIKYERQTVSDTKRHKSV